MNIVTCSWAKTKHPHQLGTHVEDIPMLQIVTVLKCRVSYSIPKENTVITPSIPCLAT